MKGYLQRMFHTAHWSARVQVGARVLRGRRLPAARPRRPSIAEPPQPAVQGGPGPADGHEGTCLGTAIGAQPLVQFDLAEAVEGVRRGGVVHLDAAVG